MSPIKFLNLTRERRKHTNCIFQSQTAAAAREKKTEIYLCCYMVRN